MNPTTGSVACIGRQSGSVGGARGQCQNTEKVTPVKPVRSRREGSPSCLPAPPGGSTRGLQLKVKHGSQEGTAVLRLPGFNAKSKQTVTSGSGHFCRHSPHPGANSCPWRILFRFASKPDQGWTTRTLTRNPQRRNIY